MKPETPTPTNRRQFLSAAFGLMAFAGASLAGCGSGSRTVSLSGGGSAKVPQGRDAVRAIAISAMQSFAGGRAYPLAAVRIAAPTGSQFSQSTSKAVAVSAARSAHRDVPSTVVYDDGLQLYKKYSASGGTLTVAYFTDAAATIPAGSAIVTQNGIDTFTNDYPSYPAKVTFSVDTSDGTIPFTGSGSVTYLDASGANTITGSFTSKRNNVTLSGTLNLDAAGNVNGSMKMVEGGVTTQVTGITGLLSGDLTGAITSAPYGWSGTIRLNLTTGAFTITLNTNTGAASATLDASGNLVIQFADGTSQTITNPLNSFLDGTQSGASPTPTPTPTPSPTPTPAPTNGAYTAVLLHSSAFYNSVADGISGNLQVGNGYPRSAQSTYQHALLWNGSAGSVVDLHPAGYYESFATGVSGNTQVGYGDMGSGSATGNHALLWTGTAGSVVDLTPAGSGGFRATGVSGDTQIGDANLQTAVLWKGTAESIVYLTPSGFVTSTATGISGGFQVGYGSSSFGQMHAILWQGTAASAVDLHPAALYASYALGVSGTTQVGYGLLGEYAQVQALLWKGTAASMVSLHPTGFQESQANATSGNTQVGQGRYNSGPDQANLHALLWTGTAESVVDLHPLTLGLTLDGAALNPVASAATAIDSNGNIVGYLRDIKDIQYAVLWVKN